MLQMVVTVEILQSELKGAAETELRVVLKEVLHEVYNDEDED